MIKTNSPIGNVTCVSRMNTIRAISHRRDVGHFTTHLRLIGRRPLRCKISPVSITSPVAVSLVCPICLVTEFDTNHLTSVTTDSLYCPRCSRGFDVNEDFVDMTLSSGVRNLDYALTTGVGTTLFQNPLVGFIYERGWRQQFATSGFPGPDREFETAMEFLAPVSGEAIMDLSCGSGLFTRRFLSSGFFNQVVAVDYSEAMLTQTNQFIMRMQERPKAELLTVRADVGRLPFTSGAFKAIFAGAAIHCWPNPALALAEISRVLQPGGVFVFSTFTRFPEELEKLIERPLFRPIKELTNLRQSRFTFWDEQQLRDLTALVGLEDFECVRNRLYVMIRVKKPHTDKSNSVITNDVR